MKAPKKCAAVVSAAAAAIAMSSGAANAQEAPAAPSSVQAGSIDPGSLSPDGIQNAAMFSVGVPLVVSFFVVCDMSVSFGNAPAGSCS